MFMNGGQAIVTDTQMVDNSAKRGGGAISLIAGRLVAHGNFYKGNILTGYEDIRESDVLTGDLACGSSCKAGQYGNCTLAPGGGCPSCVIGDCLLWCVRWRVVTSRSLLL